jgi:hypothetical protein
MDEEDPVDLKPQIEEAARPLCARVSKFVHMFVPSLCTYAYDANECIVHFDVSTLSLTSQSQQWQSYMACTERVKADKTGEAHCTGQYLDFWACLDS